MRLTYGVLLVVLFGGLLGCSSISVSSDYDQSAKFDNLRMYDWIPESEEKRGDPHMESSLVRSRIQKAVADELARKGYQKVTGTPDFYVTYHATVQEKLEVQSVPAGGYGRRRGGWGGTYTDVRQYEEGTLIIDVIDPEAKQLIWRGTGKGAVEWEDSPEKKTARINAAVQKILEQFPPKGK